MTEFQPPEVGAGVDDFPTTGEDAVRDGDVAGEGVVCDGSPVGCWTIFVGDTGVAAPEGCECIKTICPKSATEARIRAATAANVSIFLRIMRGRDTNDSGDEGECHPFNRSGWGI